MRSRLHHDFTRSELNVGVSKQVDEPVEFRLVERQRHVVDLNVDAAVRALVDRPVAPIGIGVRYGRLGLTIHQTAVSASRPSRAPRPQAGRPA